MCKGLGLQNTDPRVCRPGVDPRAQLYRDRVAALSWQPVLVSRVELEDCTCSTPWVTVCPDPVVEQDGGHHCSLDVPPHTLATLLVLPRPGQRRSPTSLLLYTVSSGVLW